MFRKHTPQLFEIFWEALDAFVARLEEPIISPISANYTASRAPYLASKVRDKVGVLSNCLGNMDRTVVEIARPDDCAQQKFVYNWHKRKHAIKFQAVTMAEGIFYHVHDPVKGRRHDWNLYSRSGLDAQLEGAGLIGHEQYCIYGDSGYNHREYLEISLHGSTLNADELAFNQAMSAAGITVKWIFKEGEVYWKTLDFPGKMRVLQLPVGPLCLAAMLLCNVLNCFYWNQTSLYFNCKPPTLEQFLSWRE